MTHESFSDFDDIPWCQRVLADPSYKRITFTSRRDTYDPQVFRLFRKTLATPETIRACIALQKAATPSAPLESLLLISLGAELDGHPGIAHGGVVATLLDEVLSMPVEAAIGINIFTIWLNLKYKKSVKLPCVLLGRATCTKIEGRKAWVTGTLEDGDGVVYAEGESLFLKSKEIVPQIAKI